MHESRGGGSLPGVSRSRGRRVWIAETHADHGTESRRADRLWLGLPPSDCVERIAGICPATDFRSWPGLANTIAFPVKPLDYGFSVDELTRRIAEFNPIDNLAPLAKNDVKILHIHGDQDQLVPMKDNSTELADRYRRLGGSAEIVVLPGVAHGGQVLYESEPLLNFLLGD